MILFDLPIYQFITNILGFSAFTVSIMKLITTFGSTLVIVTGILSVFVLFKDKKYFKVFLLANLIGVLFNNLLKIIIKRPRPTETMVLTSETSYSFPSGHSMMSLIFYGLIIYFISINVKKKWLKNLLIFVLSLLIILIGFSRIYLGVHYVSDVIGAWLIGLIYLFGFLKIYNKKKKN